MRYIYVRVISLEITILNTEWKFLFNPVSFIDKKAEIYIFLNQTDYYYPIQEHNM